MRSFIGFFVPEKIKNYAIELQVRLEKLPMKCKMVEPDNIHVCLSFLGDVGDGEIEGLRVALSKICQRHKKFEAAVGKIKIIPSEGYIRVIVLDVLDSSGALKSICPEIKEMIGGDMKPPHLTLCRVRDVSNKEGVLAGIKSMDKNMKSDELKFTVNSIALTKSELSRSGPTYTVVHEAELSD